MKTMRDICYCEEHQQYLDVYLPDGDSFPVFVYFHGGGLECGDKTGQPVLCDYLVANGVAVVMANYRMYPQAKYPDFLRDSAKAVAWVIRHMPSYGSVNGVYVGGSSAGGYISQMLCFDRSWLSAYGVRPQDIAGFIHDAGQPTCHFNVLRERGLDTRRVIVDDSAPLYHIDASGQYPRMLIIVSDNDMENRYEQTMLLVSTLKHFGHSAGVTLKVMHGGHCAYINQVDAEGASVLGTMISDFIFNQE